MSASARSFRGKSFDGYMRGDVFLHLEEYGLLIEGQTLKISAFPWTHILGEVFRSDSCQTVPYTTIEGPIAAGPIHETRQLRILAGVFLVASIGLLALSSREGATGCFILALVFALLAVVSGSIFTAVTFAARPAAGKAVKMQFAFRKRADAEAFAAQMSAFARESAVVARNVR